MPDLESFHNAVKQGDLASVSAALDADPGLLDSCNSRGQSALLVAKYYGQKDVADYLLSLRPHLDIFSACAAGDHNVVSEAIERDRSLLTKHNGDGWTPLHLAAFFGQVDVVKSLMNRGADANARSTNHMQNTPLHAAVAGRSAEAARILLERGASVDARQTGGWTALHGAAQNGDRDTVKLLLANGADVSAQADNHQRAIDLALLKGHSEVVTVLEGSGTTLQ